MKRPSEPTSAKLSASEVLHRPTTATATTTKIPDNKPTKIQDLPPHKMLELTTSRAGESKPRNNLKPENITPTKMTGERGQGDRT